MNRTQRGITLSGAFVWMVLIALVALFAAKLFPAYVEYYGVQKILASMEAAGDTKTTVTEIRKSYERRNAIEDVKSVRGDDLEITKEGGEAVITATWSVKVPIAGNFSACLDFTATTAK